MKPKALGQPTLRGGDNGHIQTVCFRHRMVDWTEGRMGSWSCPHELNGMCQRVNRVACDPGMKGCILYGRFVFSNPAKNRHAKPDVQDTVEGKGDRPNPMAGG